MIERTGLDQGREQVCPVSMENASVLIARALEDGRVQITEHFRQRAQDRKFTLLEAERVLRRGTIVGYPRYCPQFENWCFAVSGVVESRTLEIRVGVDFNLDLDFPVMALITGIAKGGRKCQSTRHKKSGR